MPITPDTQVGELVARHPATARIFEKVGVDYCCGGQATIAEACRRAGLVQADLLSRLDLASEAAPSDDDARTLNMGVDELIEHIERKHHTFTRSELERADRLMSKVLDAHGQRHAELAELAQTLDELASELRVHLDKEERMLFPYLRALSAADLSESPLPRPAFRTVLNPLRVMHEEHDAAGIFLRRLRELSGGYTPPPDACGTYRALYESLASLESDLHQHIHLENNVLFPRALPLERSVFAGQS